MQIYIKFLNSHNYEMQPIVPYYQSYITTNLNVLEFSVLCEILLLGIFFVILHPKTK